MTTDALTETVLDEAEAIVRAEWIRLQHDNAPREHARCPVSSEMPAARPRLFGIATLTAIDKQKGTTPPRRRGVGHRDVDRWAHARRAGDGESGRLSGLPRKPTWTCRASVEQRR